MQEGPLPERVQPAAILVLAMVVLPFPHGEVEETPVSGRLIGLDRRPADPRRKQPADGQGVVADHFGIQAEAALPGEPGVRGIAPVEIRIAPRRLLIGPRHDHQFHHVLDVPAAIDQLDGQPIQQLGVRRQGALRAQVVAGPHQALAEEQLPQPVDQHAGHQRIVARDHPAGQVEPRRPRRSLTSSLPRNSGMAGSTTGPESSCQLPRGRIRIWRGGTASVMSVVGISAWSWAFCRFNSSSFFGAAGFLLGEKGDFAHPTASAAPACSGVGMGVCSCRLIGFLANVGEEGPEAVEILRREGVVLVIVALGSSPSSSPATPRPCSARGRPHTWPCTPWPGPRLPRSFAAGDYSPRRSSARGSRRAASRRPTALR